MPATITPTTSGSSTSDDTGGGGDTGVVLSVGTLALEELAPGLRLDDAVGAELALADGRPLLALPHPSGASTWPHRPGNRERLERALRMVAERLGP